MAIAISLLALLILIAILVLVRRNATVAAERSPPQRPSSLSSTSAFHAVSIKHGQHACAAARDMEGKRFLSGAAPKIPLPKCDVLQCKCRFVHHKDRRAIDDRRSPFGQGFGGATGTHKIEQRQGSDRRRDRREKHSMRSY